MNTRAFLGSALTGLGCLSAWSAVGSVGPAECIPVWHWPGTCIPAHEEPPTSEFEEACGGCSACCTAEGNRCGTFHVWGWALPGRCDAAFDGDRPNGCTEDFGLTIVALHRWTSACLDGERGCDCLLHPVEAEHTLVQACDCRQEL